MHIELRWLLLTDAAARLVSISSDFLVFFYKHTISRFCHYLKL